MKIRQASKIMEKAYRNFILGNQGFSPASCVRNARSNKAWRLINYRKSTNPRWKKTGGNTKSQKIYESLCK